MKQIQGFELIVQDSKSSDQERNEIIDRLLQSQSAILVFGICGGWLSEGVDLPAEALIGSVVIGVGLPQLCVERELIREHLNQSHNGYAQAYLYPGWTRVRQTAGRVIRTETDYGIVILVDSRYQTMDYKNLLPFDWHTGYVRSNEALKNELISFWQQQFSNE